MIGAVDEGNIGEAQNWFKQGRKFILAGHSEEKLKMNDANGLTPHADGARGMEWWNGLAEQDRGRWMQAAGNTGVAADAWAAFKRSEGASALSTQQLEAAQIEAIKIMTDAKKIAGANRSRGVFHLPKSK